MITGKPLFPGRDYHHQLSLILDVLGTPTMDDFHEISSARSKDYLRALPFRKRRDLQEVCPNANPLAVDLMRRCLSCVSSAFPSSNLDPEPRLFSLARSFSPKRRITVEQALMHPYLEPYHDPLDEPAADALPADFFDFDDGQGELSREALKGASPASPGR